MNDGNYHDGPLPGLDGQAAIPPAYQEALASKPKDYRPRTHHLNADGSPKFINRLVLESSPYLLQHAHNPVNWYPWGDAAFARAKAEGKLVLMSIGYSTCHWCHVMERESFEDLEIAAYMNANYVCVKVDREERPDVDSIYMTAVNALTGRGGWPMTTILTPERTVVFGGTYFPPRTGARGSRQGFLEILQEMRTAQTSDPASLEARAKKVSERIAQLSAPKRPTAVPGADALINAASLLAASFDPVWGGFGGAPKFPQPSKLQLLLHYYHRTKDAGALKMLELTLKKMAAGGMYDHVGGGFHRYSTDQRWLVPHFEKMLYDNAQLVSVYLQAFQMTRREGFERVARETLDYVLREMTDPAHGFYSATDADSPAPSGHDEEGLFFTWTPEELQQELDPQGAKWVAAYYDVKPGGNFEGRTILNTPKRASEVAADLGTTEDVLRRAIDTARAKLYAKRQSRKAPIRDDKVLASWNGLMISALAQGAFILGEQRYATAASQAATFVLAQMRQGDRLWRSWNAGQLKYAGYLDDYAFVIAGLLDLYEATFEPKWLTEAKALQRTLDRDFGDVDGGYFFTARDSEKLLAREKPGYDGAEPSGNSVALLNLLRLAEMTDDPVYRETAERGLAVFGRELAAGRGAPMMLTALDYYLDQPLQVMISAANHSDADELLGVLRRAHVPNRILGGAFGDATALIKELPIAAEKTPRGGKPTAYVCRANICELPTSDPEVFAKQLQHVTPLAEELPSLALRKPGPVPKPWQYDPRTNRHWHAGHGHWHDGKPPAGAQ